MLMPQSRQATRRVFCAHSRRNLISRFIPFKRRRRRRFPLACPVPALRPGHFLGQSVVPNSLSHIPRYHAVRGHDPRAERSRHLRIHRDPYRVSSCCQRSTRPPAIRRRASISTGNYQSSRPQSFSKSGATSANTRCPSVGRSWPSSRPLCQPSAPLRTLRRHRSTLWPHKC